MITQLVTSQMHTLQSSDADIRPTVLKVSANIDPLHKRRNFLILFIYIIDHVCPRYGNLQAKKVNTRWFVYAISSFQVLEVKKSCHVKQLEKVSE